MYEWALETMQCLRTVKLNKKQSAVADLCRVQQFLEFHPSPLSVPVENHVNDMLAKINDLALNEKWRTARQRYRGHVHCIS